MSFRTLSLLLLGGALLAGACAGPRVAPSSRPGPRGFWRPNRFDHRGREQGRWRTYYDSARRQPFTAGRFRHGRPVGTYRYYAATGALDHSERYGRAGFCVVTYWYPGGQVARRGPARWATGPGVLPRFYWFGRWVSFAETGDTTALETYVDGRQATRLGFENGRRATLETYGPAGRPPSVRRLP